MWRWALKSLLMDPLGLTVSVAAAASAFLLVLLFEAVWNGESEQIVAYVANADADVWVMQSGVSNMHMATSYLSDWKATQVRNLPGVADAESILYLNTVIEMGEQRWFSYIVGLEPAASRAGPWRMAAGRSQPRAGEAVVPAMFRRLGSLQLGDPIRITDRSFAVVGFSEDTFSMANSVIFVTKNDLEDIMTSLDIVSFILVKAENGIDPGTLAGQIEQAIDKVHALPARQFIENDRRMALKMGVETIALMTFIGGALAALLVGFTIYSHLARQRRELAVAKALGATNGGLYASVILQAVIITATSVIVATGLASLTAPLVTALIPEVTLLLSTSAISRIAAIGLAVALLASLVSARQLNQVDPLTAFRG